MIRSSDVIIFSQAAEQAKASPALVAKDPSTTTNKKEEEDLAKGKMATANYSFFC